MIFVILFTLVQISISKTPETVKKSLSERIKMEHWVKTYQETSK